MSGFIAIYNSDKKPVQPRLLSSLVQSLKHRGPDKQNIWVDGPMGMGHALFQTTNEAKYEKQPATLDRQVWITCSARIDDRENLINKLGMKKEINLNITPDSELILHAYKKWGENCLDHLLGDFAFVIWDNRHKKIFCARDHFGVRQLYYAQKNNSFIICNSLNCMFQHPNISRHLNDKAIAGFLLFGDQMWLNDKSMTAFKDITSLQPAHKLIFQHGKVNIQKYWEIPNDLPMLHYKNKNNYIEHFQEVFKVSVKDRIRTPTITIAMSGGMDSTAIAATLSQIQLDHGYPIINAHAITAYYEQLIPCDERYYANLVANKLNMPIHFIQCDKYPILKPYITTTKPIEMLTPALWLDIKKLALSYSRVELTGASADNLFSFSPAISTLKEVNPLQVLFSMYQLRKKYGKWPSLGSGLLQKLKQSSGKNLPYPYPSWLNPDFEKSENLQDIWNDFFTDTQNTTHDRHPSAYRDLLRPDWSTDDIAFNTGITLPEERDPYLDVRLIKFAFSLPSIPWFFNKHLLRNSMHNNLPIEIIKRPKTPLGNLRAKLLQDSKNNWVDQWEPVSELSTYIQIKNIPSILNDNNTYINFRPLLLNTWLKHILY